MTPFSPNRFLKTSMKVALILVPPTSMTLAPLPMTQVTNAAPPPGQTGSCGGGRGILLTEQVCETCALRADIEQVIGTVERESSTLPSALCFENNRFLTQTTQKASQMLAPILWKLCFGATALCLFSRDCDLQMALLLAPPAMHHGCPPAPPHSPFVDPSMRTETRGLALHSLCPLCTYTLSCSVRPHSCMLRALFQMELV